jgi:zona occludens toxin (predicted ATPase)
MKLLLFKVFLLLFFFVVYAEPSTCSNPVCADAAVSPAKPDKSVDVRITLHSPTTAPATCTITVNRKAKRVVTVTPQRDVSLWFDGIAHYKGFTLNCK